MKHIESVAYSYDDEEKPVAQDLDHEAFPITLPIEELIGLFANEIGELVDYDSFEYEHISKGIHVFHGSVKLHKCQYTLNDAELDLGRVTLTRQNPFQEEEMLVVEKALAALSIHLNNAVEDQAEIR